MCFNLNLSIVSEVTWKWIFIKLKFRILKRSKLLGLACANFPEKMYHVDRFYVWYVWIAIYGIILGVKVKEIFREGNIQKRKLSN